jgi:hypothetical protein
VSNYRGSGQVGAAFNCLKAVWQMPACRVRAAWFFGLAAKFYPIK